MVAKAILVKTVDDPGLTRVEFMLGSGSACYTAIQVWLDEIELYCLARVFVADAAPFGHTSRAISIQN